MCWTPPSQGGAQKRWNAATLNRRHRNDLCSAGRNPAALGPEASRPSDVHGFAVKRPSGANDPGTFETWCDYPGPPPRERCETRPAIRSTAACPGRRM
jgi:hypothetical protein